MSRRVVASRAVGVVALSRALAPLAILPLPALASLVTFDFETAPASAPTYGAGGGSALTSITVPVDSVAISLTRTSGAAFDVMSLADQTSPFLFPTDWGGKCLSPFVASATRDKFNADFTGDTVVGVRLEYGDFGLDEGDAGFEVWSGAGATGSLLFDTTQAWAGNLNTDPAGVFSYSGDEAIGSIRFWGDGLAFPQSLYWDNLALTFIPTPGSVALLCVAGAALSWRLRR